MITPRGEMVRVWDEHDYVWTWLVRSLGNIMSELLHLVALVVLTAFLFIKCWPPHAAEGRLTSPRSAESGSCLTDSGYCWL